MLENGLNVRSSPITDTMFIIRNSISDHLRFALAKQEYAVSIPLNEICSGLEKKNEYAVSNLLGFD